MICISRTWLLIRWCIDVSIDWSTDWFVDWLLRNLHVFRAFIIFPTSNWFNRIICPRKICDGYSSAECDGDTSSRPRTYKLCGGCLGSVTFFKTIFRTLESLRSVYCHWMLSLQLAPNVWPARPLGARLRSRRHSDAGCGGKATGQGTGNHSARSWTGKVCRG